MKSIIFLLFSLFFIQAKANLLVLDAPLSLDEQRELTTNDNELQSFNDQELRNFQNAIMFTKEQKRAADWEFEVSYQATIDELEQTSEHGYLTTQIAKNFLSSELKLFHYPFVKLGMRNVSKKEMKKKIDFFKANKLTQQQEKEILNISRIVKEKSIKVIQLSVSSSLRIVKSYFSNKFSLSGELSSKKLKRAFFKAMTENTLNYFKKLFESNKNVLFVLSSGNQGMEVDSLEMHTTSLELSNIVFVGSINVDKRAKWSNYSKNLVDYGIIETSDSVKSRKGHATKAIGTSFTAAKVAAVMANHSLQHQSLATLKSFFEAEYCLKIDKNFIFSCDLK